MDKFIWECKGSCKISASMRKDSFFEGSKMGLKDLLILCKLWSSGVSQDEIKKEVKMKKIP